MKKKKKYFFGGNEPILDGRTQAQKLAWENSLLPYQHPINYGQNEQFAPASLGNVDTSIGMAQPSQDALNYQPTGMPLQTQTQSKWGVRELHPAFAALNVAALATTGITNAINDGKTSRAERARYITALQGRPVTNDPVINDQPLYFKTGGEKKPRKVDSVPEGYTFLREENGKKFYNKRTAEALQMASGSNKVGGAEYQQFLIDKLKSGITVDELVAKKYISPESAKEYLQHYIPNEDVVFMEGQQTQAPVDAPARARRGQPVYLPNKHISAEMFYESRDSARQASAGQLNTGQQRGTLRFRDDFGFTGEEVQLDGADIQKYLGTTHTFENDGLYKELKSKSTLAATPYGGAKIKGKYGVDIQTGNEDGMIKIADNAPTHEEGGVNINNNVEVEAGEVVTLNGGEVERVLENTSTERKDFVSKSLKITPTKFKELFGVKTKKSLSHADALVEADKHYGKQRKKLENKLNQAVEILEDRPHDRYANNSVDLNLKTATSVPDKDSVFDLLFAHQESVKDMLGVKQEKAQFGGKYIARTGYEDEYVDPYPGGKTKKGSTTPTGKNNKYNRGKEYLEAWEKFFPGISKMPNKEAQGLIYDYMVENNPDAVAEMWKTYGNTNKGIKLFGKGNNGDGSFTETAFRKEDPDRIKKLQSLKEGYVDGHFGVRQLEHSIPKIGQYLPEEYPVPPQESTTPATPVVVPPADTEDPFKFNLTSNRPSRFHEPLRWNDVAGPLMSYASSDRIGAQYNPVELNRVKLKLQNPTPALEAGQRDFNAVMDVLPNTGAGMANATNTFASKYSIDNQVLSQYENANVGIRNQEELYNAGVGDRQSVADAQSRSTFEQQMLGSMEASRQQKLKAFDDLFTRVALNRKLNREGNLLMQLAPNFNQYGEFNGNQRVIRNPMGTNYGSNTKVEYINDPLGGRFRIIRDADGKVISSSKVTPDNKKVGATGR